MSVPNTNTFSLSHVINEINSSMNPTSLNQCFSEAIAGKFDSRYEGSKDSLLNFRNYGALGYIVQGYQDQSCGSLSKQDQDWDIVNDAANHPYGDNVPIPQDYIDIYTGRIPAPYVNAGDYYNDRGSIFFDVTTVPDTATLISAKLVMPLLESYGNSRIIGYVGYQDYNIDYLDYSRYFKVVGSTLYIDPLFTKVNTVNITGGYYDELVLEVDMSNPDEVNAFEQYAFGNPYFAVHLQNYPNDYLDIAPASGDKNGVRIKRSADSSNPWLTGYVGFPELRIEFGV